MEAMLITALPDQVPGDEHTRTDSKLLANTLPPPEVSMSNAGSAPIQIYLACFQPAAPPGFAAIHPAVFAH